MGQELTLISPLSRCVKVMTLESLPQKLWGLKLIFMWLIMVTELKSGLQDFMRLVRIKSSDMEFPIEERQYVYLGR